MRDIQKVTVFFPDPASAKVKSFYIVFFICLMMVLKNPAKDLLPIVGLNLILYWMIYLELLFVFKWQTKKSYQDLKALQALANDPTYVPIQVKVLKASSLSRIGAAINGRCKRKAIDQSGRAYTAQFNHLIDTDFEAELYQLKSKIFLLNSNYLVPTTTPVSQKTAA